MNYIEFKNSYQNTPIINISSIEGLASNPVSLRSNINKWVRKGYLYRLKNNLYALNENDRKTGLSAMFIANNLYTSSYVSLEYAMFHYGLIPETAYEVTSVSTAKTVVFKNRFGSFSYSTVKKPLYFGFKILKDGNDMPVVAAEPEKAILDFIYLRYCRRKKDGENIKKFIKSNRVQNLGSLNRRKYLEYSLKYPAGCREILADAFKWGDK